MQQVILSSFKPPFQNNATCRVFDISISIFWRTLLFISKKAHFHKQGIAFGLTRKARVFQTQKWVITGWNLLCSSRDEKVETWEMSPLHCKSSATPIPHLMWLTLVDLCKTLPSFCKAKVMTHWTKVLNILLCSETQADANKPLSALPFPDLPTPRVLRWTTSSRHVLKQVGRFHLQMTWLLDVSTG